MTVKSRQHYFVKVISALLFMACLALFHDATASPASQKPQPPFTMGIFPLLSSGQIEKLFAPLAAHLTQELGRQVRLRTKPDFADFTAELSREAYDIAFVQPFDYVAAHDKYGYIPVARRSGQLAATLVVLPDSKLHSLQDLKGKRVGLPPKVAAVSFLTRKALAVAGLDIHKDVTLAYFKAHDACLNQLMLRKVDVCGSAPHPIRFFENKWHVKFRTLAKTKTIPPAVFMVHKRVSPKERAAITHAILSWQNSKKGRGMLLTNGLALFEATNASEYKVMYKYTDR
jgi:phosphonate transport system substrate-binding protein